MLETTNLDDFFVLSVIIPVYNTQDYLVECIDSVLNQSLNGIEIIIVDDGSDDGGSEIIEHYARTHSQIKAFSQHRKRQGAARNLGLSHASGKYVAFLDSDDTVPRDAYRVMFDAAEKYTSDMVVGIQQSFNKWGTWVGVPVHKTLFGELVSTTSLKDMPSLIGDISSCNRMIRRSTIECHNLRFPEGTAGEDLDFMARLYLVSDRITLIPEVVYNYRGRESSRTGRIDSVFFEDRVHVTEGLESVFRLHNAQSIYLGLVRSELRKLVGNRLGRVATLAMYDEQRKIFEVISRLSRRLDESDIFLSGEYTLQQQVRILMLKEHEYDALVSWENDPQSPSFLRMVRSEKARGLLFEPMLRMYFRDAAKFSRARAILDSRVVSIIWGIGSRIKKNCTSDRLKKIARIFKYFSAKPWARIQSLFLQDVWLVDERLSSSAEDNGYVFYTYLREQHPEIPAYYVIDSRSPQKKYVDPIGNVVKQFSWKHACLLWRAKVLASTDTFWSLAFPYETLPQFRRKTHNVFLQHGVAGNKTMTYTKAAYPYFSQVIVSNKMEYEFFQDHYGFQEQEVALTGIARFDNLPLKRSEERTRIILVAPTWRKWLKNQSQIRTSKYFAAWNKVITSPVLADLLERYQATLYFRPHFNMMQFITEFEGGSSRVRIVKDLDEPLSHLIKDSDLLITDYSSVMYDFFYQEKPVIAYMFDRHEWEDQPPGPPHISYENDLPIDIAYNEELVLNKLELYMSHNFDMRPIQLARVEKLFEYRDHNNCERIFAAIQNRIK